MKKTLLLGLTAALLVGAAPMRAQQNNTSVLALLQTEQRTPAQNRQVLDFFLRSTNADAVFAAGASLVRVPPPQTQQGRLLNVLMHSDDDLKKVFSAVILTAMGGEHPELSDLLAQATTSADPVLRAYAAAAYTINNPQTAPADTTDIIRLYPQDNAFAQRAMNLLCADDSQLLKALRQAAKAAEPGTRAAAAVWLGHLQTPQAAEQLLKMAKTEKDAQVSAALAQALAQNATLTQQACLQGLRTAPAKQPAATYALALGFMTGNAVQLLKEQFQSKDANVRANAARAAAYMAGVLASPQAARYSTDTAFDTRLLKGLVAPLNAQAKNGTSLEQPYAQNALKQIAKLK